MNHQSQGAHLSLAGRVALITGAGRGIGREIALAMARQGASVVVNDLGTEVDGTNSSTAPADEVTAEIATQGGQASANYDDVASQEGAARMVEQCVNAFGRIDIVVNNAGILRDRIFHRMAWDDWDGVIKTHLYGTFNVSRQAAPYFRTQNSGCFIHMTSVSGLIGGLAHSNYGAAKLGIVGLSRGIALDMARYNVRSNTLSPTAYSRMIDTIPDGTAEQIEQWKARLMRTRAEQIAPVAVFLATDAAQGINGQIIGVRGNELHLYSQPRPIRTLHRSDGWTVTSLSEQLERAWRTSLTPLERHQDVIAWDAL